MQHRRLARWLKTAFFILGIWGIVFYAWGVPLLLRQTTAELASPLSLRAYLAFALPTALPCLAALILAYRIAIRIGQNRSFCMENARGVQFISLLLAANAIYVIAINLILYGCGKSSASLLFLSLLLAVFAAVIAAAFWVLAQLLRGASHLETENRFTI